MPYKAKEGELMSSGGPMSIETSERRASAGRWLCADIAQPLLFEISSQNQQFEMFMAILSDGQNIWARKRLTIFKTMFCPRKSAQFWAGMGKLPNKMGNEHSQNAERRRAAKGRFGFLGDGVAAALRAGCRIVKIQRRARISNLLDVWPEVIGIVLVAVVVADLSTLGPTT